jgi:putative FmdB family regulatory protein
VPIYEYRCQTCAEEFEILQRMGESAEGLACPRCGGEEVHRQLSTFAASTSSTSSAAEAACETAGCGSPFT